MHFWISWYQPTDDERPLTYPPNKEVLGWWCTGFSEDDGHTICAIVEADTEDQAEDVVLQDWPEAEKWRFCNEMKSPEVGDRFPISDWMRMRGVRSLTQI